MGKALIPTLSPLSIMDNAAAYEAVSYEGSSPLGETIYLNVLWDSGSILSEGANADVAHLAVQLISNQ